MSRFYADISGGRGTTTRQGHAASGIRGHIRGWQSGVLVIGRATGERSADGDHDVFEVYATSGSGESERSLIGTVYNVGGLVFENVDGAQTWIGAEHWTH